MTANLSDKEKSRAELLQEIIQLSQRINGLENEVDELNRTKEFLMSEREHGSVLFQAIPLPSFIFTKSENEFILDEYNILANRVTLGRIQRFKGKSALELYPDMPHIKEDLEKSFYNKEIVRREVKYKSSSTGIEVHLIITYSYVPPAKISMFTVDITELKEAQLAFKRSDEFNQGIVDSTADAIIMIDENGSITFANKTSEEIFAVDQDALIQSAISDLLIKMVNCDCKSLEQLKTHLTSGKNLEGIARKSESIEFPVELNAVELETANGKEFCIFIRDITQRKEIEHAKRENARLKTVEDLAATMSHEFNTPLGIILGTVDLIEMKEMEREELLKHLEKIPRQVNKIHDLIDKFHSLRKIKHIDYAIGLEILDIHVPEQNEKNDPKND